MHRDHRHASTPNIEGNLKGRDQIVMASRKSEFKDARRSASSETKQSKKNSDSNLVKDLWLSPGMIAPPLGLGITLGVIEAQPHFSWTTMTISDLLVNHPGSLILSSGDATSGVLGMAFAYGLHKSLSPSKLYDVGTGLVAVSMTGLTVTALTNPITQTLVHDVSSGFYYYPFTAAAATLGAGMIQKNDKVVGGISVAAFGAALYAGIAGFFSKNRIPAEFEFSISSIGGTWMFLTATHLILRNKVKDKLIGTKEKVAGMLRSGKSDDSAEQSGA